MAIIWPVTLPTRPLLEGYSEQLPDYQLRSQSASGVAKVRPKNSSVPWPMTIQMVMTSAQVDTLKSFFNTTLGRGCLRFQFSGDRTGSTFDLRFTAPPKIVPDQTMYMVSMQFEVMP